MKIVNNIKIIVILTFFIFFTIDSDTFAQFEPYKKFDPKKKDWELYVTFTTSGGGLGSKIKWGDRKNVQRFFSFEVGGVRGKNEFTTMVWDPYYGYYPYKINQTRYMVLFPFHFGFQKRLFEDAIEENFRPFLDFEFGPVIGMRFPVGHGLFGNIKRGKTGVTLGGFLGAGIEFGDIRKSAYIFSLGYRISYFFKKLVNDANDNERDFSAFVIRLGMLTQF